MKVITSSIDFKTAGRFDIVDITDHVHQNLRHTLFREGSVTVFNSCPLAGLIVSACDDDSVASIKKSFEKNVSETETDTDMYHCQADLCRAVLKNSLTIPFRQSKMLLGTLQKIYFIECDERPRERKIITQYIGI